ncbi:unnamed protein product, partial [Mycena citricolor]
EGKSQRSRFSKHSTAIRIRIFNVLQVPLQSVFLPQVKHPSINHSGITCKHTSKELE